MFPVLKAHKSNLRNILVSQCLAETGMLRITRLNLEDDQIVVLVRPENFFSRFDFIQNTWYFFFLLLWYWARVDTRSSLLVYVVLLSRYTGHIPQWPYLALWLRNREKTKWWIFLKTHQLVCKSQCLWDVLAKFQYCTRGLKIMLDMKITDTRRKIQKIFSESLEIFKSCWSDCRVASIQITSMIFPVAFWWNWELSLFNSRPRCCTLAIWSYI